MTMTSTLGKLNNAYRTRDALIALIKKVVGQERPLPRQATVTSVHLVARTCVVNYPGETIDVTLFCGSIMPAEAGCVVRVAGPAGARYVEGVVSGPVNITGIS